MTKLPSTRNLVLYADDDQDDLTLVEQSFAQYSNNVDVVTFPDGHRALHFLLDLTSVETSPCLIILDVNMPGLTGKEILVRIRELPKYKETPVILFSTSSLPSDKDLHFDMMQDS